MFSHIAKLFRRKAAGRDECVYCFEQLRLARFFDGERDCLAKLCPELHYGLLLHLDYDEMPPSCEYRVLSFKAYPGEPMPIEDLVEWI